MWSAICLLIELYASLKDMENYKPVIEIGIWEDTLLTIAIVLLSVCLPVCQENSIIANI